MRVLLVHNHYRTRGGEDQVFATESELLEAAGHQVRQYTLHNDLTQKLNPLELAVHTVWNRAAFSEVRARVRDFRADVVHVHNSFPLLSPAVHHAAKSAGAAVVQTLHNYRLYCPAATFFRNGQVCEVCAPLRVPWPAIAHACYRDSFGASIAAGSSLLFHRVIGTWTRKVDVYIALSEFSRDKFVHYGLPADKLRVKPNAVFPDPGPAEAKHDYGIYVGRLSPEKGLRTLLGALRIVDGRIPFRIVGGGPLESEARRIAEEVRGVSWLGELSSRDVLEQVGGARFLVVPSEWFEAFPRVVVEALARSTPIIASRIGSLVELVSHGRTGLHVEPGSAEDLARQMLRLAARPDEVAAMGAEARKEYEALYGSHANLELLEQIYEIAIRANRDRPLDG